MLILPSLQGHSHAVSNFRSNYLQLNVISLYNLMKLVGEWAEFNLIKIDFPSFFLNWIRQLLRNYLACVGMFRSYWISENSRL